MKARIVYEKLKGKFSMNIRLAIRIDVHTLISPDQHCFLIQQPLLKVSAGARTSPLCIHNGCKHVGKAMEVVPCSICDERHRSLKTQSYVQKCFADCWCAWHWHWNVSASLAVWCKIRLYIQCTVRWAYQHGAMVICSLVKVLRNTLLILSRWSCVTFKADKYQTYLGSLLSW